MKLLTVLYCIMLSVLPGCGKKDLFPVVAKVASQKLVLDQPVEYTILKGQHYCDKNDFKQVDYQKLNFVVRFDSSAVYESILKENQFDINKLFGFSDNGGAHHVNSARFGWRWSDNALRLFAYVYNNEKMISKELGTLPVGMDGICSIGVNQAAYQFVFNGDTTMMPRSSTTTTGTGYKLYPYFGGDEVAPHNISINIREFSSHK